MRHLIRITLKGDITLDAIGGLITVNVVSISREVLGMFLLVIEIRAVGRGVQWVHSPPPPPPPPPPHVRRKGLLNLKVRVKMNIRMQEIWTSRT